MTLVRHQQDQLLNLRLLEEGPSPPMEPSYETAWRVLRCKLNRVIAIRVKWARLLLRRLTKRLETWSQTLKEQWVSADYRAKRRLLEIVCLNFTLEDVTLVPEWRKPFDVLAEGLDFKDSRADWRFTFPNDSLSIRVLGQILAKTVKFSGEEFYACHPLIV